MKEFYRAPSSKKLAMEKLKNSRSKQLLAAILSFDPTINILEVGSGMDGNEYLYLRILPDIPNNPINDIREEETIMIVSSPNNELLPKVFATREDFPLGLPHTNFSKDKRPVSLCVFEDDFHELKLSWSGTYFLRAIKQWLELTARNELHQKDQLLEPFMIGNSSLIFDIYHDNVEKITANLYRTTNKPTSESFHKGYIEIAPIDNGVVNSSVDNLAELTNLFGKRGINIIDPIGDEILKTADRGIAENVLGDFWRRYFILLIAIPIYRNKEETETTYLALKINQSLGDLLRVFGYTIVNLNAIFKTEVKLDNENLKSIPLEILNIMPHLNVKTARYYSTVGVSNSNPKISLIGLGALGSQFFMNLARGGYGIWTLIDKDVLLPHNFIRHAATNINSNTGRNKAIALSNDANELLNDSAFSTPCPEDVAKLDKAILKESDVIVDISTSIAVQRFLVNDFKHTRKISAFLNPMGVALVLLCEDEECSHFLDLLEHQYYKELISDKALSSHLHFENDGKIRYARGCRDATSKIPQENLSVFSGIASKVFKSLMDTKEASISIWQMDNIGAISLKKYGADNWVTFEDKGWTVLLNQNSFLEIAFKHRNKRLPNETGGIIIGAFDTFYKKIYITNTILSPDDSIEKPNLYIRGIKGVEEELGRIGAVSNYNLMYLGEWHSHPKNHGLQMSSDDKAQFAELLNEAKMNGQPAIMIILGDDSNFELYIDNCEL
tara:strand:+ start:6192 stop:8372 length:2181 start_codon:yes stop_codon:yes gene_type:complete